jgi:hypothetical protein
VVSVTLNFPGDALMTSTLTLGDLAERAGLALGALATAGVAYLVHPEHGGSGIAPGTYVIRRQRERSGNVRREADGGSYQFIAD